jgi:hypothetical protein
MASANSLSADPPATGVPPAWSWRARRSSRSSRCCARQLRHRSTGASATRTLPRSRAPTLTPTWRLTQVSPLVAQGCTPSRRLSGRSRGRWECGTPLRQLEGSPSSGSSSTVQDHDRSAGASDGSGQTHARTGVEAARKTVRATSILRIGREWLLPDILRPKVQLPLAAVSLYRPSRATALSPERGIRAEATAYAASRTARAH